jgi:hypothetical protein
MHTTIKFYRENDDGNTEVLTVTQVTSLEINGVHFSNAHAIVEMFYHPERLVKLSVQGERGQLKCAMFQIVDAPPNDWEAVSKTSK